MAKGFGKPETTELAGSVQGFTVSFSETIMVSPNVQISCKVIPFSEDGGELKHEYKANRDIRPYCPNLGGSRVPGLCLSGSATKWAATTIRRKPMWPQEWSAYDG
jgi:hypothetical protein